MFYTCLFNDLDTGDHFIVPKNPTGYNGNFTTLLTKLADDVYYQDKDGNFHRANYTDGRGWVGWIDPSVEVAKVKVN